MTVVRIILMSWYLILSVGMSVHLHYCMGRLKSVSVILTSQANCLCGPSQEPPACCDDEIISLSVDEPHVLSSSLGLPPLVSPVSVLPLPLITGSVRVETQVEKAYPRRGPPPLSTPRYVAHQSLIFYG